MNLVSQSEFARACGVTRQAVSKWKQTRGLLAFVGGKIDVQASRELLRRYRRDGVPDAMRDYLAGDMPQPASTPARRQTLPRREWLTRLQALDWATTPDWSAAARHQRIVNGAALVGLVAVWDDDPDGISRHGGWQIRDARLLKCHGGPCTDAVWGGHGFELDDHDALCSCRLAIEPPEDWDLADEPLTLDPAALALLAYPFNPCHTSA